MPELTFCLHNGYYVADATMVELYAKFRPGRLVTEDFSGNAFILSPDDLSEEEEVWPALPISWQVSQPVMSGKCSHTTASHGRINAKSRTFALSGPISSSCSPR